MRGVVSYDLFTSRLGTGGAGFTVEGGFYQTLINKTGANSVKGTIVAASLSTDNAVYIAPADSVMPIGIIYENNIADGSLVKVVVNGKAQVLLKDGIASTNGYWCGVSDTNGRMYQEATTPTTTPELSRKIGHSIEAVSSGLDVLSTIIVHFN
jgi:hypothetical protein